MSKTFFIADTHFGDKNIIKFENRPFRDVDEMNETMIKNWDETVEDEDTVFVVGDFISSEYYFNILTKLKGHIKLIVGNHDIPFIEKYKAFPNVDVYEYPIIYKDFWIISHEPLYISENMPYAVIFGHIHNNPMYKTVSSRSYCVSAERIYYTPMLFENIEQSVRM